MPTWSRLALLALLPAIEIEGTSVAFPEPYSTLKASLPIPLGHTWAIWLICVALLAGRGLARAVEPPRSRMLGLHAALMAALWSALHLAPSAWVLWLPLGGLALVAWGLAWIPPRDWQPLLRPLLGATVLACGIAVLSLALQNTWTGLSTPTMWTAYAILRTLTGDARCDPTRFLLGAGRFGVTVLPACSGLEGIGMMAAFSGVYLWLFRRHLRFPRAWLLLPVSISVIWFLNAWRLALLVLIGARWSPQIAMSGFHSHAGWMAFILTAAAILVSARWWLFQDRPQALTYPSAPYLVPFLAQLILPMVTGLVSTGFDTLYPLRVVVLAALLYRYRHAYADLGLRDARIAAVTGFVVFGAWLALYRIPAAAGASPFTVLPMASALLWIGFRTVGAGLVVPFIEEQMFRNFLMRRLISPDFESVPVGRFSVASCVIATTIFAALHQQWLAALVAGAAYAAIVYRTKGPGDAILAHAVTNLCLSAYVLATGRWDLWL